MFLRATKFFNVVFFLIMLSGCANPFSPTGGPKDNTPPVALVYPKDTILNYSGEKLIWAFDEYIQPIQKQNIFISPQTPVTVDQRGRSIILSLDQTTRGVAYNLLIKDAIKDYNEGNVLPPQSLWITTYSTLSSNSLSYFTTILPPKRDLETFTSSIRCENPELKYSLLQNGRLTGRLNHLQTAWKYVYTWYWDKNSNGKADPFEGLNQLPLSFIGGNEAIIHSPLRKPVKIDSLNEGFYMIYPKPDPYFWDSVVKANGYVFSTYKWGHDTVYALNRELELEADVFIDSAQRLSLASLGGTYSSDTMQALVLVSDTIKDDRKTPHLLSISLNNLDSLTSQGNSPIGLGRLCFVSFSLPNYTMALADTLIINVFTDEGALLLSDVYREGAIYSLYGEPSYATLNSTEEDNRVLYYVDAISTQQGFLVSKTLVSTETINFIND